MAAPDVRCVRAARRRRRPRTGPPLFRAASTRVDNPRRLLRSAGVRHGSRNAVEECRSGNVLFRRSILDGESAPFREEFGNGGEDKDFFLRMTQKGHVFRWCNEGVTYETVPRDRWTRRYMLKRALLRGKNILKHRTGRARVLANSVVAVPVYCLVLLPTLVVGQHCFMKYCIKLGDHVGRLLAFVRINPVSER